MRTHGVVDYLAMRLLGLLPTIVQAQESPATPPLVLARFVVQAFTPREFPTRLEELAPDTRGHPVRFHLALIATLGLAACSGAPASPGRPHALGHAPGAAPAPANASLDSTLQFLLTSAATDFRDHRPPDPVRFRDVRLGHFTTPAGERRYLLCGQFLPAPDGARVNWMPFATIKTSGYEQWLGAQAAGICQDASVGWYGVGDLSSALWSRFESLR